MEGRVIVVTSGKGGVGKTTAVANLGTGLAAAGSSVVLVDADIGLRNLDIIMGLENRIVFDLVHVAEGRCKLRQALIKDKRFEKLCLLPASQSKDKTAISPEGMKALTEELKSEFDFVIVDCPAGIEQGFKNATAGADEAIIVTTPEVSAVRDADRIVGLLESQLITNHRLIINRVRVDMVKKGDMMDIEDILDILAIHLLGVVPDDESIIVSSNRGEPAVLDQKSRAGEAFRNIIRRLRGEDVSLMSLEKNNRFVSRLRKLVGLD